MLIIIVIINYYNNVDIIKLQNKGAYMHVKVYFK